MRVEPWRFTWIWTISWFFGCIGWGGSHGAWMFWKWGAVFIAKKYLFGHWCGSRSRKSWNNTWESTIAIDSSLAFLVGMMDSIGHPQEEKWELWRRFQVGDSVRAVRAEYLTHVPRVFGCWEQLCTWECQRTGHVPIPNGLLLVSDIVTVIIWYYVIFQHTQWYYYWNLFQSNSSDHIQLNRISCSVYQSLSYSVYHCPS